MMEPQRSLLLPGSKIWDGEEIMGVLPSMAPMTFLQFVGWGPQVFEAKFVDPGNSTPLAFEKMQQKIEGSEI